MEKAKSKTIHVDFKSKKVLKVEEHEYSGVKSLFENLNHSSFFSQKASGSTNKKSAIKPAGTLVDPAAYLESVVVRFEEILDSQGCFDEMAYKNPQVYADALNTFKMLEREIPMLIDVSQVLRDIITIYTGNDPKKPANLPKFVKRD